MGARGKIVPMTPGARIKDLRLSLGLTQQQLAKRAAITQGSLSSIERGSTKGLKADTIIALAKALGTNPQWLQTGKGAPGEALTPDPDEVEAIHILRALSPQARVRWLSNGRWMMAEESAKPTKANPFPAKVR